MRHFLSVKGETVTTCVIERSKFICYLKSVNSEEEAKEYLKAIGKEHSLATHCCYAFVLGEKGLIQKFSDDGEPQGTAGIPILEAVKNNGLVNVICIVVRYFGGIKLGAGGLVRAYTNSAVQSINEAEILKYFFSTKFSIKCLYENYSKLLSVLNGANCPIVSTQFNESIIVDIIVKEEEINLIKEKIAEAFNGQLILEPNQNLYYPFKK